MIRAIVFDVGYTLIDEARQWAGWARELDVPADVFTAALRLVIADRRHHREVFRRLRPEFDLKAAQARRDAAQEIMWNEDDLYPDARPALTLLKGAGFQIGLAGNQPPNAKQALQRMRLPVDWIANSAEFGAEKPSPDFFACVIAKTGRAADEIAYVGDRLDNDVLPAQAAGMRGVFLVRGPWGDAHAAWPQAAQAQNKIASLPELAALWPAPHSMSR